MKTATTIYTCDFCKKPLNELEDRDETKRFHACAWCTIIVWAYQTERKHS